MEKLIYICKLIMILMPIIGLGIKIVDVLRSSKSKIGKLKHLSKYGIKLVPMLEELDLNTDELEKLITQVAHKTHETMEEIKNVKCNKQTTRSSRKN